MNYKYYKRKGKKIYRRMKKTLGNLFERLVPTTSVPPINKSSLRKGGRRRGEREGLTKNNEAFANFAIKVNHNKSGWQNKVISVMQSCPGAQFNMDEKGILEVSGICDPYQVLRKTGPQSSRIELRRFQFGQCSSKLFFIPENNNNNNNKKEKKKKESLADKKEELFPHHNKQDDEGTIVPALPLLQQQVSPYNNYYKIPFPSRFNYYPTNSYNNLPLMYNPNPNGLGGDTQLVLNFIGVLGVT
ncbi:heavy metal transport/detoxification superfamily protein [Striga asiatica]|uniref:Heavy metal transport/detoxification superfamily protein n=1 Tax=Striga asiatica TaxID=4170 RepID=A0A5A7RKE0_STRAF|nr:heavy metal transport/detoxification superfamily protein [Striga asiatica]